MSETQWLAAQLRHALDGSAWHGPSLAEALERVTAAAAHARPLADAHTIAELVAHIAVWLEVPARRLAGEAYEPAGTAEDWPPVTTDEAGWRAALDQLHIARGELEAALADTDDSALDQRVPGRDYDVRFMLHGVVQHVVYHTGQVKLLAKAALERAAGGGVVAREGKRAGDAWLAAATRHFRAAKDLAERAAARLDDDAFLEQPDPESNSVAVIMKHMAGNLRSRWTDFPTTDGEKPDRDRDGEFVIRDADSRASIMAAWDDGWSRLFAAVEALGADDLARTVHIRGEPRLVADALLWQLAHHAGHAAQIVYRAKMATWREWESLSVPRKGQGHGPG
jgi:uncharacterized damage-inducible protein DinB